MDISEVREALERDGVVHLPQLLSPAQLADAEAAFEWSKANPSPRASVFANDPETWQDLSNPLAYDAYRPMLERSPIPPLLSRLWDAGPVWFMYEQTFVKNGSQGRTVWHQDTSYLPVAGSQLVAAWITFEPVPLGQALEFCLASHKGPLYNGSRFTPGDPTDPLYPGGSLPRLPDIEAERDNWNIAAWPIEPGDVMLFHTSMLHGGGATARGGLRRTLTLRFFGEDAVYDRRPGPTSAPQIEGLQECLRPGDPFRHPLFPRLV